MAKLPMIAMNNDMNRYCQCFEISTRTLVFMATELQKGQTILWQDLTALDLIHVADRVPFSGHGSQEYAR